VALPDGCGQGLLGAGVAVHEANLRWLAAHATDEVKQIFLVGVGGIAAESVDASADRVALPLEDGVATFGAVALDIAARRATRLVANEQDVVARVAWSSMVLSCSKSNG